MLLGNKQDNNEGDSASVDEESSIILAATGVLIKLMTSSVKLDGLSGMSPILYKQR
jgi:hypothetical protein